MLINKTRLLNLKCISFLKENTPIKLAVKNIARFPDKVIKFGFPSTLENGHRILPCCINKSASRNAEYFYTIDKDKPKQQYTQTLYWTRHQWNGEIISDFTDSVKYRYHRDYHLPFSVEFTLDVENGISSIYSDELIYSEENVQKILNTINLVLGAFGECEIVSDELPINTNIIRLSWELLPIGDYPWTKTRALLDDISKNKNKTQKQMLLRNCDLINKYNPDFRAIGKSGFKGYIVFGFNHLNLFIFESILPNNATYFFESNWVELSKLSKGDILCNDLHKHRIIHNSSWEKEFTKFMEEYYGKKSTCN